MATLQSSINEKFERLVYESNKQFNYGNHEYSISLLVFSIANRKSEGRSEQMKMTYSG
ncbi:hypothetical protein [Paenibacillus sp. IHBB 3054]|uniref:hypothetical protein n=1 Tax=Paenibacillus sp. IHBB 3054 TaxID=3425689 RepID=UPI003F672927